MNYKTVLFCLCIFIGGCESPSTGIEPVLLEKDFCPYLRFFDTYCNGSNEWGSDDQWKIVIEDLLREQGVQAREINLYYRRPEKGFSECPCGAISGHYAEVLVDEQDWEKLIAVGFKACEQTK